MPASRVRHLSICIAELKRLRRENAVLKQERGILKQSRGLLREREKSMTFGFIEAERAIEAPMVRAQWRVPASRSAGCAVFWVPARAASSPGRSGALTPDNSSI